MSMSEAACLRALLRLSRLTGIEKILDEVLGTLLEHTRAQYGYVEVLNERACPPVPTWRARARSDEHIGWIQAVISRGIIGRARIEGRTVATPSAIDDARFADLGSVREHEIGGVVCSPFDGFWTSGVIYLQSRPMADLAATCEIAELAAVQVGLLAEHFRRQIPPALTLEVELDSLKREAIEEALRRYDWNLSAVQRETGLSRKHIREFMRRKRH
jgi:hypothetical protein